MDVERDRPSRSFASAFMSNGFDMQGHSRPHGCRTGSTFKVTRDRIHFERVRYARSLAAAWMSNGLTFKVTRDRIEGERDPPSR